MRNLIILLTIISIAFFVINLSVVAAGFGSIGATAYLDTTCNGLDLTDTSLVGKNVELKSTLLPKTLKAKTDVQGNVVFTGLPYGSYILKVVAGKGFEPKEMSKTLSVSEVQGAISETYLFCRR